MPRNVPLSPEKEEEILAALEKDPHASRVARTLRDVSYATVWRVAERAGIELTAGRETMGRPRLPPEVWAKVKQAVAAHPEATQLELARQCGVSRSTVGRVVRARHAAPALAG
jgi:hypothetical protein